LLAAAGLLLITFVIIELLGAHPMFDLSLFRLPTFDDSSAAALGLPPPGGKVTDIRPTRSSSNSADSPGWPEPQTWHGFPRRDKR
jgi:hypothetical protein